ncbi:nuclear transport factor 2 family protein [Neorhizobium sp. T786]|uniref:nuclear transport factor 2 family protein n=1 Tax=Pseudorhizobium xiangyangii TaxID=2883104 RepID=UPI001CFF7BB9|nr:nuclear transport factor 2 family protein [Neorhizobium xiangyangii]MCB5201209.1 nuclear transport factor 2 family protein [Neorhizobium xiangyangii]
MTKPLPHALAAFYAAKNSHDIEGALAQFTTDAIVTDERQTRSGHAEIRAWLEETTRTYNDTAEVLDVEEDEGSHLVRARVTGTFPGSPVTLSFRYTLCDGQIAQLEIG